MRHSAGSIGVVLLLGMTLGPVLRPAIAQTPRTRAIVPGPARRIETPQAAPRREVAEKLAPIPMSLAARLAAPVPRELMLRSLRADGATMKTEPARQAGAGSRVFRRPEAGAERPPRPAAAGTSVTDEPASSTDASEEAYRLVDWTAGVTFTPFSIPTYGPAAFPLGALDVGYARILTWQPGALYLDPPSQAGVSYSTIELDLELPTEPAMYMVAVRLTGLDGQCPVGWVRSESAGWPALHITVADAPDQPQFTPLLDGSGYVGICSLTPERHTFGQGPFDGMRRKTATIYVSVGRAAASPPMGRLVFGGITVTRL
jgi:hypothetical protein